MNQTNSLNRGSPVLLSVTSSDTPVVTGLGEGARQKILIHQVFDRSVKVWVRCEGLFHPHVPCPWQSGNELFEKVKFYLGKVFGKRRGKKQSDKGIQDRVTQKI